MTVFLALILAAAAPVCGDELVGAGSITTPKCIADFHASVRALTADDRAHMTGRSFHDGCPVPLDALAIVTVSFWDFDAKVHDGEIVVARAVADDVVKAFKYLYFARFPIARLEPVDAFGGDDDAAMAANDTSAFNCRLVPGTKKTSQHAHGLAIDLNPVQNPWIAKGKVMPPAGNVFADRHVAPGVIVADGPADKAFRSIGWKWGGRWKSSKDYQHFSQNGK